MAGLTISETKQPSIGNLPSRHLNTEFGGLLHKVAPFGPLSDLILREDENDQSR
jgi:hypothetical protein